MRPSNDSSPFIYYLVIPHPTEAQILAVQDGESWSIPHFTPQEQRFGMVSHINEYVMLQLGLRVVVLRCLHQHNQDPLRRRYYALDNLDPHWQLPANARWFGMSDLVHIEDNHQRETLQTWFRWVLGTTSLRAPWAQRGWFNQVRTWMFDISDRMDMAPVLDVEQYRTWARACTVRLQTDKGMLYCKAVAPSLSYEPVITRVLSLRYPGRIPEVRAVHVDNGWVLTHGFEGEPLYTHREISVWEDALNYFARIQIDLSKNTGAIVALGVPDRHLDYLVSQIDRLMIALPEELSNEEERELRRISGKLRNMFYDLMDHSIPLALIHGDFRPDNVVLVDGRNSLIFDWSDSAVTHPFFDMTTFLTQAERHLTHVPNARERLLNAYLEPWTRYEPLERLREAYEICATLAHLQLAIGYHGLILPGIEESARWEVQPRLALSLRYLLRAFRDSTYK